MSCWVCRGSEHPNNASRIGVDGVSSGDVADGVEHTTPIHLGLGLGFKSRTGTVIFSAKFRDLFKFLCEGQ